MLDELISLLYVRAVCSFNHTLIHVVYGRYGVQIVLIIFEPSMLSSTAALKYLVSAARMFHNNTVIAQR